MNRVYIITVLLFLATALLSAQEPISTWPISSRKAGENILFKPTDYIETEKNSDGLYITEPEGTAVIAPVNGTIISYDYSYNRSLNTSSGGFDLSPINNSNIAEYDKQQRKQIADKRGYNPQFVSLHIGISNRPGERYWIVGLRPISMFKTGYKIKKGDTIGYVGYCYKQIPKPCIKLSRSINGKQADPMTPFGLKTSFIPYKPESIKSEIPVSELIVDFNVFRQALEEAHPGLNDYTSRANMDSTFERIQQKLNKAMSPSKFYGLLLQVLDSLRDSHTALYNTSGQTDNAPKQEYVELPVQFGFQHDSLLIFRTLPKYKHLLNKRILKIDNEDALSIFKNTKIFSTVQEGYIDERSNFYRLCLFYMNYKIRYNHQKGDSVMLAFSDGTKVRLKYQVIKDLNEFLPKREKRTNVNDKSFEVKLIDNNTTYLNLRTFGLTSTDEDSLQEEMKKIKNSLCKNLIIDVRYNPGGNDSYSRLFAMLAKKPFSTGCLSMVKSNSRYAFLKNAPSYYGIDTVVLFGEYNKIDGKEGYYIKHDDTVEPNDSIHFDGDVYLLVNENSKSASTLLAALVHKYKRGIIIGRETGTCYYQMNANKFVTVQLNNSALELYMPLIKDIFDDKLDNTIPYGHGVIPDFHIEWTYDEYFRNNDPILNFTLNKIKESENAE